MLIILHSAARDAAAFARIASASRSAAPLDSSASLAWCEVSDTGLTFTVNVSKTLQAIAYVKRKGVFHTWELAMPHRGEVPDERLEFGINLATLLECLKIFGGAAAPNAFERSQTALHISFREGTRCLCLQLNEKASVTECEIHSLEIDQPHKTELKVREGERPPARLVVCLVGVCCDYRRPALAVPRQSRALPTGLFLSCFHSVPPLRRRS